MSVCVCVCVRVCVCVQDLSIETEVLLDKVTFAHHDFTPGLQHEVRQPLMRLIRGSDLEFVPKSRVSTSKPVLYKVNIYGNTEIRKYLEFVPKSRVKLVCGLQRIHSAKCRLPHWPTVCITKPPSV